MLRRFLNEASDSGNGRATSFFNTKQSGRALPHSKIVGTRTAPLRLIGSGSLAHPMLLLATNLTTMKLPKKILLIDHEPGVTRLVRQALETAGKYLVQEEHDDHSALQTARGFQPDLILLDTVPTSPEGQVLERQIHSDAVLKDTPVVRLSNLKPESQMVSGGILSGYSFFAAPVRIEEVLRGVENILFGKD